MVSYYTLIFLRIVSFSEIEKRMLVTCNVKKRVAGCVVIDYHLK